MEAKTFSCDSDTDSAISSMGSQQSSSCSCDSCACDISFSSCESDSESCQSAINPFGSFRHSGALPYSVFEDSSSFSCSRVDDTMSTEENATFQNSTHIYINTLERTDCDAVKTTKFWTWEHEEHSLRPDCDGQEYSIVPTENLCNANPHIESKVGPWLQKCVRDPIGQALSDELSTGQDNSVDSDATYFFERRLHNEPVTTKSPTKKQRLCISKKLRAFRRLLKNPRKGSATLNTLAVI